MSYDYLPKNKLVAVVDIADPRHAEPLCEALLAGGVSAIEITLRNPKALAALQAAADAVAIGGLEMTVGAGTILSLADLRAAQSAGAAFFVSPAAPLQLLNEFANTLGSHKTQMIPGVATASEAMAAYALGFEVLKFFPAEASGGVPWLKSVAGPLPHIRFMPTGGVREATLKSFTELKTVAAVGGTWLAPAASIAAQDWNVITTNAKTALATLV